MKVSLFIKSNEVLQWSEMMISTLHYFKHVKLTSKVS